MARVLLVAHALTPSLRHHVFGGDDEPDQAALAGCPVDATAAAAVLAGPARAAVRTAEAFGATPVVEAALRDCDYGTWTGRRFAEVLAEQPAAVEEWLSDPRSSPHGGESVEQLVGRVGGWLRTQAGGAGTVVAVTHPAVVRAAVILVLDAPLDAFRRIDVRPLTTVRLGEQDGRWTLVTT